MVPLSVRRHRLYTHEVPEVKRGLLLRLQELCEAREDRESAEVAYRTFLRLNTDKPGRPKYPVFIWGQVQYYVNKFLEESD
jgi:hypothetical protein